MHRKLRTTSATMWSGRTLCICAVRCVTAWRYGVPASLLTVTLWTNVINVELGDGRSDTFLVFIPSLLSQHEVNINVIRFFHFEYEHTGHLQLLFSMSQSYWFLLFYKKHDVHIIPYPTAFPYGNGMVLHFYQQQESSTTKTVHKVINKRLKTYV